MGQTLGRYSSVRWGGLVTLLNLIPIKNVHISYGYEGDSGLCSRSGQYVRPSRSCLVFADGVIAGKKQHYYFSHMFGQETKA